MFHFKTALSLILVLFCLQAGAADGLTQRAERRESKRWTLQEWLAQKDRNRMMDMWLSMNSPSPFELMLGGSYNSYQSQVAGSGLSPSKHTSYQGVFSAYAQLVGLSVEYENNTQENLNDLTGIFNLRLIGHTIQGSYLAVHFGQRTRNMSVNANSIRLNQQFAQASLQMYATKFFGFDGLYRQYLPGTDDTLGDINESLTEAGVFIDFRNFRIFGSWYKESQNSSLAGTETETTRTGIRSGLKIFF